MKKSVFRLVQSKKLLLVFLVFFFAFSLFAGGEQEKAGSSAATDKKVFVAVTSSDPNGLDPTQVWGYSFAQKLILEPLIALAPDYSGYAPNAAKEVDISEDGTDIRLTFDPEMRFPNGDYVEMDDITGSFEWFRNNSPYGDLMNFVESMTVEDGNVLHIKLSEPSPLFIYNLSMAFIGILDMEVAGSMTPQEFNMKPVGYGLFSVDEWEQGLHIKYKKHPYFKTYNPFVQNNGPSHIDEVVIRIIPDSFTQAYEFGQGNIDYIQSVPFEFINSLKDDDSAKLLGAYEQGTLFVQINSNSPKLTDVRVRKAIAKAFNRQEFVDLRSGYAMPQYSLIIPVMLCYNKAVDNYVKENVGHDPDGAIALLKQAGYADSDGDGIVEKDGEKLTISLVSSRDDSLLALIQAQLARVGIEVKIEKAAYSQVSQRWRDEDYDIAFNRIRTAEPVSFLKYMVQHQTDIPEEDLQPFVKADKMIDLPARTELYTEGQKNIIADKAYVVPLYSHMNFEALSAKVTGYQDTPIGELFMFYHDLDLTE